jgi:anaerobic magnesium-protoporphyrin IX monomethyl ester cyclase
MPRILLIKCSQHEGLLSVFTFPLGVMYLASTLRRESDRYECAIFDLRVRHQDYDDLKETVSRFKPDIVGLSAITMEASSLYRAAKTLRETGFEGPVIAGGPHPTCFPEESLACPDIDYLVLGEGEETCKELVSALVDGRDPRCVPGIAYRENGRVQLSAGRVPMADLDQLAPPAWDLVEMDKYFRLQSMAGLRNGRYMNLFTSRACPYRCTYCHSQFGSGFRARSAQNVLEEVKVLVDRYDIEHFEIVDDIFNCDLDRSKEILDRLHAEGLPIEVSFPNGLRCDRLDREFLEKFARFKFSLTCVPVETASPRLQKMIKKNLNLAKVSETIDTCAELGIYTRGYFMLGFPTETEEELRATVDFAANSRLHTALFFVVVPFKGTDLYDQCLEVMKERSYRYEDYDYFRSPMNLSEVPDKVLFRMQKWAYFKLGMRPSRIYRLLRDIPDYKFIWFGAKVWASLFLGAGKGHRSGKPQIVARIPKRRVAR